MAGLKLKQLQYEIESWKRVLGFMTDENNRQKIRLSEFLKNHFASNQLAELENFLSLFLKEDDQIATLKNDVNNLEKLLERETFKNGHKAEVIKNKLQKLGREMNKSEIELVKLRTEFNNYLSENILQTK